MDESRLPLAIFAPFLALQHAAQSLPSMHTSLAEIMGLPSASKRPLFYVAVYAAIGVGQTFISVINSIVQYVGSYRYVSDQAILEHTYLCSVELQSDCSTGCLAPLWVVQCVSLIPLQQGAFLIGSPKTLKRWTLPSQVPSAVLRPGSLPLSPLLLQSSFSFLGSLFLLA